MRMRVAPPAAQQQVPRTPRQGFKTEVRYIATGGAPLERLGPWSLGMRSFEGRMLLG